MLTYTCASPSVRTFILDMFILGRFSQLQSPNSCHIVCGFLRVLNIWRCCVPFFKEISVNLQTFGLPVWLGICFLVISFNVHVFVVRLSWCWFCCSFCKSIITKLFAIKPCSDSIQTSSMPCSCFDNISALVYTESNAFSWSTNATQIGMSYVWHCSFMHGFGVVAEYTSPRRNQN